MGGGVHWVGTPHGGGSPFKFLIYNSLSEGFARMRIVCIHMYNYRVTHKVCNCKDDRNLLEYKDLKVKLIIPP